MRAIEKYCERKGEIMKNQGKFIKRIYANYLLLQKVPDFICQWNHLNILSLVGNSIKNIDLSNMDKLVELYLNRNEF